MYSYSWDEETGGLLLNSSPLAFSKEPRPVYIQELNLFGFDKFWHYEDGGQDPIMWAEANKYIYRGRHVATVKGGSFFTAPTIQLVEPVLDEKLFPVDIGTMIEKNREILDALTQQTIKKLYDTYLKYKSKVDVFHVSYSGGKDSEVTLDIVRRALPHNSFVVIFGDTGMEFPDTYESVEEARMRCESEGIKFYVAKSHFEPTVSWRKFGPPSSTIRWCCSVHKTTPQLLLLKEIIGKSSITEMALVGVRADESVRRSGYDYISYGTKQRGQYSYNPILEWNSAEVYLYIMSNGLHLNEAYRRGISRAGCLVCPMSTDRNDYLNNYYYKDRTKPLLDIIGELNLSDKGDEARVKSYIENHGWKARKNGRDISIATRGYDESIVENKLVISFRDTCNNFFKWIKTVGEILSRNKNNIQIESDGNIYSLQISINDASDYRRLIIANNNATAYSLFLKKLRYVCRKTHYCVGCRVCMANCKYGNIKFDDKGCLSISDNCTKCGQCLDIDTGCYAYKSLWLSKGLGNMNKGSKSIDCYAGHAPKIEWFQQLINLGDRFFTENTLGNNQVPVFNRFLRDAGILSNMSRTKLGTLLFQKMDEEFVWALMLANLAYTPEVGWYINSFDVGEIFGHNSIVNKLKTNENVSESALKSIPSALKRISYLPFNKVGFGYSEKSNMEDGGTRFIRTRWLDPDPRVVLYSLYLYAEACGGYYQYSLSHLYDDAIESAGISPGRIYGTTKDEMKSILIGLSSNFSEYISVSFTHDLDNITLKSKYTSQDILELF